MRDFTARNASPASKDGLVAAEPLMRDAPLGRAYPRIINRGERHETHADPR
jgi:hypothetical protein